MCLNYQNAGLELTIVSQLSKCRAGANNNYQNAGLELTIVSQLSKCRAGANNCVSTIKMQGWS